MVDDPSKHTTASTAPLTSSSLLSPSGPSMGISASEKTVTFSLGDDGNDDDCGGGLSSPSSSSHAPPLCALARAGAATNAALNGFVQLQSKGVGLDMALKTACWTLRLVSALSEKKKGGEWFGVGSFESEERHRWAATLISAIIDERMMFNQWKWISTARNALNAGRDAAKAYLPSSSVASEASLVSPLLSPPATPISPSLLRAAAESKGSLAANAAVAVTRSINVPRAMALFGFFTYFFRTFEQGQGDIGFWNRFWFTNWDSKKHSRRYKLFKSITLTFSLVLESLKIIDFVAKLREAEKTARPPRSVAATPAGGCPSFDHAIGVTDLRQKLQKSILLWLRNVGDMIIYFQWIEAYRPNRVLASLCGIYSGAVGVYLVWTDNRDAEKKRLREQRLERVNGKAKAE